MPGLHRSPGCAGIAQGIGFTVDVETERTEPRLAGKTRRGVDPGAARVGAAAPVSDAGQA